MKMFSYRFCKGFTVKSELKPLGTKPTRWSNTLKQFVGNSLWGWRLRITFFIFP